MKLKLVFSAVIVAILSACSTTQNTAYYQDDIYYNPNDKPMTVSEKYTPVPMEKTQQKQENRTYSQLQQEYQRSDAAKEDNRDFSQIQEDYLSLLSQDTITEMDTLVYFNDETGYWVDGFQGSHMDQDYAERMIKFHGPFNGIPYWSPVYNDVVYFNNYDWNVYVDGNYAYAYPTWTNPYYNSYRYNHGYHNPWRWGFSMSWGWGYPYYGYGGCDPWYGYGSYYGCYGWGGGYHHGYNHGWNDGYWYGSGGHYPGSGGSYYGTTSKPRYTDASSVRPTGTAGNTGPRTTRMASETSNTPQSATRTSVTNDNKVIIQGNTRNYTRVSRSQYDQSTGSGNSTRVATTKTNTSQTPNKSQVRTTRRSYTPSYSRTTNNSRSSYNRNSTYTRSSNTTTRPSSSTRRTQSSSVSNTQNRNNNSYNSNNKSYNTGSSSRSSSSSSRSSGSYSPSRSSSSSSPSRSSSSGSYSPSRSSSSSSGSSSSSSSGSSTRSSGGGSTRSSRR